MRANFIALFACLTAALGSFAVAQEAPDAQLASSEPADRPFISPLRPLAERVFTTIPTEHATTEDYSRHDVVEILCQDFGFAERPWRPNSSPAKQMRFAHDIWSLEFSFKPLRMVEVDVPNTEGNFDRKLIWYLVYTVKNTGDAPVQFFPDVYLHTRDSQRWYPARLIPVALPAIERREKPAMPLRNLVEVMGEIPPSTEDEDRSVWGVFTWESVDPDTDEFSLYIQGLTNAYQWVDEPAQGAGDPQQAYIYRYQAGDTPGTGRKLTHKTLVLNFWRPGDRYDEHEGEVRFGIPGEVDFEWVYK